MNLDPLSDRKEELALRNYNKVAKNQDRYTQFLAAEGKKNRSPVLGYLEKLSNQPVNPRQNGFNFKTSRVQIDLNCQSLKEQSCYLDAVAAGIKKHKHLRILNLKRTDLDTDGATLLFKQLNRALESLDSSYNPKIGKQAYTELAL